MNNREQTRVEFLDSVCDIGNRHDVSQPGLAPAGEKRVRGIQKIKVLLVEDNPGDARLIRIRLDEATRAVFESQVAATLKECLQLLVTTRFDMILLDLGLPDSSGLDTFLKVMARARRTPIVVLSGLSDEELAVEAVRSGAQDYLVKGQDDNLLVRAILYAMERRRLEAEQQLYIKMLERSNEELQDFAFVASHDLKEPLRKIRVFGGMLHEKALSHLDDEGCDYLKRMQNASTRMEELLDALLRYSRVATHGMAFKPCDLTRVAMEAVADLDVQLAESGAEVRIEPLGTVEGDEMQFRQVFSNLIGNSLKYHGPEKPVITIRGEMPEDCSGLPSPGGRCYRVCLRDNGIGFHEKYLDRIFKPFQRLHTKLEYGGTGMGLAICRKIIERHGGSITARSKPGEGATFIVTLPVEQESQDRNPCP